MKRIFLILVASAGPVTIGACEKIPPAELNLETQIDINVGNGGTNGGGSIGIGGGKEPAIYDGYFDYEEIMQLESGMSSAAQGGDCWGDYFFQFVTNNTKVRIFDLSLKTLVQTVTIPTSQRGFVPNCHCNTVCFGTEYYDAEDIFPLIYVSTGYASEGFTGALVYRITKNALGVFSISLVQTIKFPVGNTTWTEFVPAQDCAYLCYTGDNTIYKVKMPQLKDGDMVIDPESAIESYQFTPKPDWMSSSRNQDRLFHQGKVLYVSGVPSSREASVFVVLNLEKREREMIVDFQRNGLTSESESIFVWQGDLCVAFLDRIVKLVF